MENAVLDTIGRRRSCRSYKPEQISDTLLQGVLDAGRCAPYAGKPPHITVVQNASLIAEINTAAKAAAMGMGLRHLEQLGGNPDFIGSYGAPTLVIISDQQEAVAAEQCCGAVAENMLIAAEALGLGACWVHFPLFFMYGDKAEEIKAQIKLPEGNKLCACIVLGYKGADVEPGEREYSEITLVK